MSFAAKTDYLGLANDNLIIRSNSNGASNTTFEIVGSDGSILSDIITGHIKNPTCEYAIKGATTLSGLVLGKCNNPPYALSEFRVSTSAGSEPTASASGVQIEANANNTVCTYAVDSIAVTPAHHAITFGAFTFTESANLTLQSSEFTATANIAPVTINNDPIASDATQGRETVTATFWNNSDETNPTISPSNGWHITTDWAC